MIRGLSLFTGYGGIDLALKDYVKPIAYVEIEPYAQKIISYRMAEGSLPRAAILGDVKNITGKPGDCDIIYGGFPCQNISTSGDGTGLAGKRSGLYYEIVRLAKEIQPTFIFLENVAAIRTRGLDDVVKTLTEIRYDCRWLCISASDVGANHKRERWFLLAHTNGVELREQQGRSCGPDGGREIEFEFDGDQEQMANTDGERLARAEHERQGFEQQQFSGDSSSERNMADSESIGWRERSTDLRGVTAGIGTGERCELDSSSSTLADTEGPRLERYRLIRSDRFRKRQEFSFTSDSSVEGGENWWAVEPNVGRVVNGTPFRMDRIKATGNGVVPLQVLAAFEKLLGIENYLLEAEEIL